MIKFWIDQARFYTFALMGPDSIFVYQMNDVHTLNTLFPNLRKNIMPLESDFRCIRYNDVKIDRNVLAKGFKI